LRYRRLAAARRGRWAANLLSDARGPLIVAIMTITPTTDMSLESPRPYLLLSTARLDEAAIKGIGERLRLDGLRLLPRDSHHPDATPIITDDGKLAGYLDWNAPQPGETLLTRVLPIFAILLLVALLHSRLILRRLRNTHRQLSEQEENARFLAFHDGLSELPNRRYFNAALAGRLEQLPQGRRGARICVAYVDVDRFKDVNDAIGHSAGDALVAQIGPRLRSLLHEGDLLARLGGDEFAVLRALEPGEGPHLLGQTILAAFGQPFLIDGTSLEVTASIGLAVASQDELDPEQVLRHADISLYKAKDDGRNRYVVFEPVMAAQVRFRHETEVDLRSAIGTGQIGIHYQPIISTRDGRVTGFETLVRWRHPQRGQIGPADFIPLAEQTGLMVPLGDHILEKVFREMDALGDVDVAVNLSPVQLRQRGLPERLSLLTRRFGVDPRRVILEVTETMLVEANEITGEVFAQLRALGFRRALDDFGTGYSSLAYLSRFEFDKIKIDRSFISAGANRAARPILEGIVHIGRGLGVDIIAEGVESAAELALVQSLGIGEAQGYYIAKPMPLEAVPAFLARQPAIQLPPPPELQLVATHPENGPPRSARARFRAG
jgi:diguanylate cyclase (GGDEF)-like protein